MKKKIQRVLVIVAALVMTMTMSISVFAGTFTQTDAMKKALKNAGVKASQVYELETETKKAYYEVEFTTKKDHIEYEYKITKDGKIKEIEISYPNKVYVCKKKIKKEAAQKAAAKATGVKLSKVKAGTCKYKLDDGQDIYKLKYTSGKIKYQVEILAATGKVLEIEKKFD